jgi:glycine oxidase
MSGKVLILGGGIIGLASALAAAGRGFAVTVIESGRPGGQASGAAAGMLAPYTENTDGPDAFFALCLASLRMYPGWLDEIGEASGRRIELHRSGSLAVAFNEADVLPLTARLAWQNRYGANAELVGASELRRLEPQLAPEIETALHIPEECHVYAPALVEALVAACRRRGVDIAAGAGRTVRLNLRADGVEAETEHAGAFAGDRLVICTGAWTGLLERELGLPLPVHPIRGQICAYPVPVGLVRRIVVSPQAYWTAKSNGTLVCGASEDVAGFDASVTERGIARLVRQGPKVFPILRDLAPVHRWAGLRPGTLDGRPLIGRIRHAPQVIVAAGHYRNGILLAPVTGEAVAALLAGEAPPVPLAAFDPHRFEAVRQVGAGGRGAG